MRSKKLKQAQKITLSPALEQRLAALRAKSPWLSFNRLGLAALTAGLEHVERDPKELHAALGSSVQVLSVEHVETRTVSVRGCSGERPEGLPTMSDGEQP
jgi:hypothetical protein